MTEEVGHGIREEVGDLRDQFRAFRNWIISGALAMTIALIGQSAVIAWKASDIASLATHNERRITEARQIADRNNDEIQRRAAAINQVGEIRSDIAALRDLMQSVREDVLRLKVRDDHK